MRDVGAQKEDNQTWKRRRCSRELVHEEELRDAAEMPVRTGVLYVLVEPPSCFIQFGFHCFCLFFLSDVLLLSFVATYSFSMARVLPMLTVGMVL